MRTHLAAAAGLAASIAWAPSALAWDAHGHRTIALLAMDVMATQLASEHAPDAVALDWLQTPESRLEVGYQAAEPDRYRAIHLPQLRHENDPEHYIDVEDLAQFGLTLSTIPPLRYEYLRAMAISKHEHPEMITKPYNEKTDVARTAEWPGFSPYAIMEHYGKLTSSFRQIRVLSAVNDPERAYQVTAARANVIFEMGQLAHFVGDAAQPLHTTRHHHGWIGDNPSGYTTNRGFHAYIDTTVLAIHHFSYDTLKGQCKAAITVNPSDPWQDVLAEIQRAHDTVEAVYALQKSGDLDREPGKVFIQERLCDGAATLGALYAAAWKASTMTDKDVKDFMNFDQPSQASPSPMDKQARPTTEAPSP